MPQYEGTSVITLQPYDTNIPYQFEFTVCSASTANDGAIPAGHTINSTATYVKAHRIDGTAMTTSSTGIIAASSHTGFITTIWLTYPTSTGVVGGRYHLTLFPTISDGTTTYAKEFNFNRLVLKDL
jgi:hypothetical protein